MEDSRYFQEFKKYDEISFEYEKRFVTSLTVVSAAGFASLISFSSQFENKNEFFFTLLPSFWGFFLALVFAGALPFIMANANRHRSDHYGFLSNRDVIKDGKQNSVKPYEAGVHKWEVYLNFLDEKIEDQNKRAAKSHKKLKLWTLAKNTFVCLSSISFIGAISWPLYLITVHGELI